MGVGNYSLADSKTVYLDFESVYGKYNQDRGYYECQEDIDDNDGLYYREGDMLLDIRGSMLSSFSEENSSRTNAEGKGIVVGESRQHEISVVHWDGYFAINLGVHQDLEEGTGAHNLALANLDRSSDAFFKKLHNHYDSGLSVKTSAWTSGPYTPPEKTKSRVDEPVMSI